VILGTITTVVSTTVDCHVSVEAVIVCVRVSAALPDGLKVKISVVAVYVDVRKLVQV
jgi:hypothetical protein